MSKKAISLKLLKREKNLNFHWNLASFLPSVEGNNLLSLSNQGNSKPKFPITNMPKKELLVYTRNPSQFIKYRAHFPFRYRTENGHWSSCLKFLVAYTRCPKSKSKLNTRTELITEFDILAKSSNFCLHKRKCVLPLLGDCSHPPSQHNCRFGLSHCRTRASLLPTQAC